MNDDNFQYKDTYFMIWHPESLWIIVIVLVVLGALLFYLRKKKNK